jgi:hypothetical protein
VRPRQTPGWMILVTRPAYLVALYVTSELADRRIATDPQLKMYAGSMRYKMLDQDKRVKVHTSFATVVMNLSS